jgi:hypothetical protein
VKKNKSSFSPDRHRRQTQTRLFAAGFLILLGVGGGLVWLIYGRTAALTTAACLLSFLGLAGLLGLILWLLERWVGEDEP